MIMKTPDPPDIKYRSVLELLRKNASDFPEETCLISIEQNNSLTWRDLSHLLLALYRFVKKCFQ
mgnify:CR=1 FL=1